MNQNTNIEDKVVKISYKWKCPVKKLRGEKFDDFIDSPAFLVAHNGVYHELRVFAKPAGSIRDKREYRKHMGVFSEYIGGLAKSIKLKMKGAYSTDQDPQEKHMFEDSLYHEVRSGECRGSTEAIQLVLQSDAVWTLPFHCNTVMFHVTCSILESAFRVGDYLPRPLVPTDDSTATGLHKLTLIDPRHPTVDLTLVCEDGLKVHVHKSALALTSDVFKILFESDLKKDAASHEIKIDTLKSQAVEELVRYAYLRAPSAAIRQDELVIDVLKAAHMYMMEAMVGECETVMVNRVMHDAEKYAVDYYCFAAFYDLKILLNVCTVALLENWDELRVTKDSRLREHRETLIDKVVKYSRQDLISVE